MTKNDLIADQVLNNVPAQILIEINNGADYARQITQRTGRKNGHINKTIHTLENHGYLNRERDGRINQLTLTEKGEAVAIYLTKIREEL